MCVCNLDRYTIHPLNAMHLLLFLLLLPSLLCFIQKYTLPPPALFTFSFRSTHIYYLLSTYYIILYNFHFRPFFLYEAQPTDTELKRANRLNSGLWAGSPDTIFYSGGVWKSVKFYQTHFLFNLRYTCNFIFLFIIHVFLTTFL